MKLNEAPEKIYIDDPTGEFDDHWSIYKNNDSIEYTRTDAFIEKALEWIKDVIRPYYHEVRYHYEDFENYMKGE